MNKTTKSRNFAVGRFVSLAVALAALLSVTSSGAAKTAEKAADTTDKKEAAAPQLEKENKNGVLLNRVRYIVGDVSITELDIAQMEDRLKRMTETPGRKQSKKEKSAVDELIRRALVDIEARKESLLVTDQRIENELRAMKERSGISDEKKFQEEIEKQSGLPFDVWIKDMRYILLRSQLIQLKIEVPRPSLAEAREYYDKNKSQGEVEVAYRVLTFSGSNELQVLKDARAAWAQINKAPHNFISIARTSGGSLSIHGYTALSEVARDSRRLAGILFNTESQKVAPLFRDKFNRYLIVQPLARQYTPFEKVQGAILQRLYVKKEREAFETWLDERKKQVAIIEVGKSGQVYQGKAVTREEENRTKERDKKNRPGRR